ncbi:LamG domain-containing protein [Candidatus Poribacteria bacterium]|nr:LamG domain-containing protein [Candidatus Poribacteria bacterium]
MNRNLVLSLMLALGLLFLLASFASAKTVALWLCDEGSGKTLIDNSGNGHDGTLEGKTGWTEGKFGKALELHGDPDKVVVPGSKELIGPTAMTVEMWLKAPAKAGYHIPISKGLKGPGHWEIYLHAGTGSLSTYIPDLGDFTGTHVVTDNEWHHCVMIWDGSSIRLYADGEKVDEWKNLNGKKIVVDDQKLHIGHEFTHNNWHTGLLDEIRISDTALEVEELGFNKSFASEVVDQTGKLAISWGRIKTQGR